MVFGTSIAAAVAIIPFMVLNYNGVLYSYYVGGELRRPGRTYLYASAISIVVLVVLWVGVWALLRARVGLTFMQAQANLGVLNPTAYGKITSLSSVSGGLGYGMVLSSDPITKILFATAVPLAEIAVNLAFLTVTTRVLFAQAFDRLLPVQRGQGRRAQPRAERGHRDRAGHRRGILLPDQPGQPGQHRGAAEPVLRADPAGRRRRRAFLPLRRPDLITTCRGWPRASGRPFLRKVTVVGAATTILALFTVYEIWSRTRPCTASSASSRSSRW